MKRRLLCALGALSLLPAAVRARELAERLLTPDHLLLMRHAYAPGTGDPAGYSLDRCETQRLLNSEGQAQAQRIGQWLRLQGVARAQVHTSPWCRCRQTAELLKLGPVTIEPSLASFFDEPDQQSAQNRRLQAFIAKALQSKGDQSLVLVTHHVNIRAFTGQDVGSGDMVLVRVNAQGQWLGHQVYRSL
jgi:phosphohistidine phosphatase SixA